MLTIDVRRKIVEQMLQGAEQQLYRIELDLKIKVASGITIPPGYQEAIDRKKMEVAILENEIDTIDSEV